MGAKSTNVLLVIKGVPVPKGRPRFGGGHTYTPPKTRKQEELIKAEYLANGGGLLSGAIEANYEFIYEPPKSWSLKHKVSAVGQPKVSRPDQDNLIKLVQDALNGVAYTDDAQICKITSRKIYGAEAMTIIRFREVDNIG